MWRLALITLIISIKFCVSEIRPCSTALGITGFCIDIKDCFYLNDKYFRKGSVLTPDDQADLLDRKCSKNPLIQTLICCDKFNVTIPNGPTKPLATILKARNTEIPPNTCGKSTASNSVPWMAIAITENANDQSKFLSCTGTMISNTNILFPVRCLENVKYILLGFQTADITRKCIKSDTCSSAVKVSESDFTISRHPDQSFLPIINNIAIIKLKSPINHPKISPICLPIYDNDMYQKKLENGVVAHGFTYQRNMQYLEAPFDFVPADLCQLTYKEHFTPETNLCLNSTTMREGADLTMTISSSVWSEPRTVLYGIMSYGDSIKFKKPDVFTHIRPYLNWILDSESMISPTTPKPTTSLASLFELRNSGTFSFMSCGNVDGKNRVSGGSDVKLYSYPWFAYLKYDVGGYKCGGTLISDRHILTAAHCFKPGSGNLVSIRLGEHDLSKELDCQPSEDEFGEDDCAPVPQDMEIEKIIMHPKFDKNPGEPNDIALVRLKIAPTINDNVKKICLPFYEPLFTAETPKIFVAGFGFVDEDGTKSNVMQAAVLEPSPFPICKEKFDEISNASLNNNLQFCAGGKNLVGSCSGDSGGPIMAFGQFGNKQKFMQYGVVSAGPQCKKFEGYPGVYVRVTAYLDWIVENIIE